MTRLWVSSNPFQRKDWTRPTPGPWIPIKGIDEDEERWGVYTDGSPNYHIATIENGAPGDTLDTEGHNARLIAAAPDMLAALKALVGYRDRVDALSFQLEKMDDFIFNARKAIAKVEGKS